MYPYARFFAARRRARNPVRRDAPPPSLLATHVTRQRCWPWDIDPWGELNNGRTLTLYDLGRMPISANPDLVEVLRAHGWGMVVAGASVRYRRRIRMWQRFTMLTRMIGWDAHFFYVEQAIWRGAECANHILLRIAVTSPAGIVAPGDALAASGLGTRPPVLPDWVQAWIAAEDGRPWPPCLTPSCSVTACSAAPCPAAGRQAGDDRTGTAAGAPATAGMAGPAREAAH